MFQAEYGLNCGWEVSPCIDKLHKPKPNDSGCDVIEICFHQAVMLSYDLSDNLMRSLTLLLEQDSKPRFDAILKSLLDSGGEIWGLPFGSQVSSYFDIQKYLSQQPRNFLPQVH